MAVKVIRNFPPLDQLQLTNKQLMREVGLLARERIVQRTRSGLDMNDVSFQPYSASYALQKFEAVGKASPDLTLSGGMLNALQILEITDDSVTLGFRS